MGVERQPNTGERGGSDSAPHPMFCFQFKLRKNVPAFVFEWLGGIVATAMRRNKIGVLVMKQPGMRDEESLVVLRWKDWCDLHGTMQTPTPTEGCARDATTV